MPAFLQIPILFDYRRSGDLQWNSLAIAYTIADIGITENIGIRSIYGYNRCKSVNRGDTLTGGHNRRRQVRTGNCKGSPGYDSPGAVRNQTSILGEDLNIYAARTGDRALGLQLDISFESRPALDKLDVVLGGVKLENMACCSSCYQSSVKPGGSHRALKRCLEGAGTGSNRNCPSRAYSH